MSDENDDLYASWVRAYEAAGGPQKASAWARNSLVIAAPQFLERYEREHGLAPVKTIVVRSRHLIDYVLTNEADGSRWRPTRQPDGEYTWERVD